MNVLYFSGASRTNLDSDVRNEKTGALPRNPDEHEKYDEKSEADASHAAGKRTDNVGIVLLTSVGKSLIMLGDEKDGIDEKITEEAELDATDDHRAGAHVKTVAAAAVVLARLVELHALRQRVRVRRLRRPLSNQHATNIPRIAVAHRDLVDLAAVPKNICGALPRLCHTRVVCFCSTRKNAKKKSM